MMCSYITIGNNLKIMISQPMNGKTEKEIKKERKKVIQQLEMEGHEVVDSFIDGFTTGAGDDYALRCLAKSIDIMTDVDGVVFLPGWENARGCQIEHEIAVKYGKWIKEIK